MICLPIMITANGSASSIRQQLFIHWTVSKATQQIVNFKVSERSAKTDSKNCSSASEVVLFHRTHSNMENVSKNCSSAASIEYRSLNNSCSIRWISKYWTTLNWSVNKSQWQLTICLWVVSPQDGGPCSYVCGWYYHKSEVSLLLTYFFFMFAHVTTYAVFWSSRGVVF